MVRGRFSSSTRDAHTWTDANSRRTAPPDFDYDATLESFDRFEEYDAEYLLYGHYGVNYDGGDALERHREALDEWVDEIREAIRGTRETEKGLVEAVVSNHSEEASNPIVREVMARDVRGVLNYLDG